MLIAPKLAMFQGLQSQCVRDVPILLPCAHEERSRRRCCLSETAPPGSIAVSVVLPVYNEQAHLQKEIDRISAAMRQSEFSYEIIVVDDGSTDGSSERLRTIGGIRLVQYAQNRGSGFARRAGSAVARGDVVVWTDVDMTYPNDRIPELVRSLEGDDQIVGASTSEQGTVRLLRVPAKLTIRKFAEYLVSQDIPDLNSGMRAFRGSTR